MTKLYPKLNWRLFHLAADAPDVASLVEQINMVLVHGTWLLTWLMSFSQYQLARTTRSTWLLPAFYMPVSFAADLHQLTLEQPRDAEPQGIPKNITLAHHTDIMLNGSDA